MKPMLYTTLLAVLAAGLLLGGCADINVGAGEDDVDYEEYEDDDGYVVRREGGRYREVRLEFVNYTDDDLDVEIAVGRRERDEIGEADEEGGVADEDIKVYYSEMPARVRWWAGPYYGDFYITEDSPPIERVHIGRHRRRVHTGDGRDYEDYEDYDDDDD